MRLSYRQEHRKYFVVGNPFKKLERVRMRVNSGTMGKKLP